MPPIQRSTKPRSHNPSPRLGKTLTPLLALLIASTAAPGQSPRIPDFTFQNISDGSPFSRKDIPTGRKTLFVFFDTECPHCRQALITWNANIASLQGTNTLLLTMDPPMAAIPFLQNVAPKLVKAKDTRLLFDPNRQFIARFLPKKYPSMFLFSPTGELVQYTDEEKDIPSLIRNIRKK